jgi:hypothetical protein
MATELPKGIESGFESIRHYEESMREFTRVLDYLDRAENISEETKEKYHHYFDEIGLDGVFELARNTNELFKELGINLYRLQQIERGRKGNEAQGNYLWSLEEIADIGELKYGEGLTWKDTTSEMNEKYGENWPTSKVTLAYHRNKDKLPEEEE